MASYLERTHKEPMMAKTPKRWHGYPKLYKLQKLADRINNKFTLKQIDEGMYLSAAIGNKVLYRHPASLVQYIKDHKKYLAPPVRKAAEEAMDEARKIDRVVKGASGKAIRRDNPDEHTKIIESSTSSMAVQRVGKIVAAGIPGRKVRQKTYSTENAAKKAYNRLSSITAIAKWVGFSVPKQNPKRNKRNPAFHTNMRAFWDTVNRALLEQDFDVDTPEGRCSNLICGGYLQITAHGIQYRAIPGEHTTKWVSWEPFTIIGHFSALTDPNAVVEYIPHRKHEKRKVYELHETQWPM